MKVIIHCSDSSFGNAALLTKWHVQGRGWSNIGYHYVILNGNISSIAYNSYYDGHIETGRPLDDDAYLENFEYGAHVKGLNDESVGICMIGESGKFTKKQINSLERILMKLRQQFEKIEISQHSDWDEGKPYCSGLDIKYIDELNVMFT